MQKQIEAKLQGLQKKFDSLTRKLVKQAKAHNIESVRGTCDQMEVVDGQMHILEELLEAVINKL